ncbi:S-adenosyl-L-methionine-dependent methyltransferase [Phanerochaete sordida]|uniref:S-adenosyl-L-methionine-dependent methyltransferase n=1 Tax=Phanerochaete sordida TaxID=48140 RepID=A0A9P3GSM7_9APHY|nr:S-adenosyl-L-methionine-dependent methyltransferase [Phanerochaete sordida]
MTVDTPEYLVGQADAIINSWAVRRVADSAAYLAPALEPHMKILDVGCGPGSITIDLARHVPRGHVTGVDTDAASETLAKARAQAAQEGVTNVEFAVADAFTLPFADGTFDAVHAHQVIQYVDDPVRFLREMRRVAKPGGVIAVRTWDLGLFTFHPSTAAPINRMIDVMVRTFRETGREPYTGRNLHVWAREAGFDPAKVKLSSSNETYHSAEEKRFWGHLAKNFSVKSAVAKVALSKGFITKEELDEVEEAFGHWVSDEDGWFIQVNMELLAYV